MKLFVRNILFFISPVIIVFSIAERFLRHKPNSYAQQKEILLKNSTNIQTLVLGNSNSAYAIDSEKLQLQGFNISNNTQTLNVDIKLFEKYRTNLSNLGFLVINISYKSLFTHLSLSVENWREKDYNLFYDISLSYSPKYYSELFTNSSKINKTKLIDYSYRKEIAPFYTSRIPAERVNSEKLKKNGLQAAERHTKLAYLYYRDYISQLDEAIKLCESRKVKVVFFRPQTHQFYRSNINTNQYAFSQNIIDSLVDANSNVFRLNLFNSFEFNDVDFRDADYLGIIGAENCTIS